MTASHHLQAAVVFMLAFFLSLLGMEIAGVIGRRLGMISRPRLFGAGGPEVSYLGGAALAVALAAGAGIGFFFAQGLAKEAGILVAGALVLLALGLADDGARVGGISPSLRVAAEVAVAAWVYLAGVRAKPTGIVWVDFVLTVFFLVAAANAFNLLDNMDGVAGVTAATVAAGLFALAALAGQYLVAVLAAAVFGASLGFLRYNLVRPRVYLGNGGALFLGFLLGAVVLKLKLPLPYPWSFVAAIAIVAVPATDTSIVILSRLIARRPPAAGGLDHLSHRLVRLGLSTRATALAHCAGCAVGVGGTMAAVLLGRNEPLIGVIAAFTVVGLSLLRVSVYEPAHQ